MAGTLFSGRRRWLRRVFFGTLVVAGTAALCLLAFPLLLTLVPLPPDLLRPPPPDAQFLDRHGQPLREAYGQSGFRGERLVLHAFSDQLARATLAAEDRRFWQHHGVDWRAITRAAWQYLRHQRVISGGSTVTMQLIKLSEPRPRTLPTKVIEALQALRLEQLWSKEKILAEYLNRLDYGHGRVGSAAATSYYFGKTPADLSAAEAAFLAGIPQAPSRHDPFANFARIKKRQTWILGCMREIGWLSDAEFERAAREPLKLQPARRVFQAPHFVDLLLRLQPGVADAWPKRVIRTTLDLELNRVAESILREHLEGLREHQVRNGAVVVIDNRTGDVLALVGSEDYFNPTEGQVNGAWAPRSAGSTFKPFTYLIALERGATPASVVADVPTEFPTPTGVFAPVNYNRQCYGPLRYRLALANSLNIPAVKVLNAIGGPEVLLRRLHQCGLETLDRPAEHYGLGLTIGNAEARLLELANAYACLARLGEHRPFRLLKGLPAIPDAAVERVFDANAAYLLADMLSDNAARALAFGTHSSLRFDFPVACKTGTSSDFRDNWAFGYTPEFTVGVWVGNFNGEPMRAVSGVSGAAPVMHDLMVHLRQRFGVSWYERPAGVVERWVHPVTGKLVPSTQPGAVREKFLAANLPSPEDPADYDAQGRVRLSSEYREWWIAAKPAHLVVDASPAQRTDLRVVAPLPGTVFYLDPDLPDNGNRLALKTDGGAGIEWRSDTLRCETNDGQAFAILQEGHHQITARNPATGAQASTWIVVRSL